MLGDVSILSYGGKTTAFRYLTKQKRPLVPHDFLASGPLYLSRQKI